MLDGRYLGDGATVRIDLRVDAAVSHAASGDVFRLDTTPPVYVASFRTLPGATWVGVSGAPADRVLVTGFSGRTVAGTLRLEEQPGTGALLVDLSLAAALDGLAAGPLPSVTARRLSASLRRLGLEIELESGVAPIQSVALGSSTVSVQSCLAGAGYDVSAVGAPSTAPPAPAGGWQDAQLHTLMVNLAQAPLSRPDWAVHVLVLSRSADPRLLGWMFDRSDDLPRQGCVVFATTIRALPYTDPERKLLQTVAHEVGHTLNLVHPFEPHVGHAESTSIMNYDWAYLGGGHPEDFWKRFRFQYDERELAFLRHGRLADTVPGGSLPDSAVYWADLAPPFPTPGTTPTAALPELTLEPPAGGTLLAHGQPVFLGVSLTNRGSAPLPLAPGALDVKSGHLRIRIARRRAREGEAPDPGALFRPLARRCRNEEREPEDALGPGETRRGNLQLTFGAQGFPFAEPGEYEVRAALDLPAVGGAPAGLVTSRPLRLRVAAPMTMDEERDALVLLRPDVGLYFALGGSARLARAGDDLLELVERRRGKKRTVTDPVSVCALRARAFHAARAYPAPASLPSAARTGDLAAAVQELGRIGAGGWGAFDADTQRRTRAWGEALAAEVGGPTKGKRKGKTKKGKKP